MLQKDKIKKLLFFGVELEKQLESWVPQQYRDIPAKIVTLTTKCMCISRNIVFTPELVDP